MGFDFLMVSDAHGTPLTGVVRSGTEVTPLDAPLPHAPRQGLMEHGDKVYQIGSVPVDQGEDNMGTLSVGERFDFSGFSTPAVLIRNGRVLQSNIASSRDVEAALKACRGGAECDGLAGDPQRAGARRP